jgi:outer membrane protein TolC
LEQYIQQVTGENDGARASELSAQGSLLRQGEGSLPFTTHAFFNADYSDDQRLTGAPAFQGTSTRSQRIEGGLSQKFRFGLDASVGYLHQKVKLSGVSNIVAFSDYNDQQFQLKLSQSLWRNGLGSEARALEKVQVEQARALSSRERFNLRLLETDARVSYWNLLQAKANVVVQREAVVRAGKIRETNQRKSDLRLTDRIDLLQATANFQFRELQLRQAEQELARVARAFNNLRGKDGDQVEEDLASIVTKIEIARLAAPVKGEMREDVKAMLSQSLAERAQAEAAAELNRPKLDVFATLSTNGKADNWSRAYHQVNTDVYTQNAVGLRFTAPLDVGLLNDNKAGRRMEAQAADLRYKRKAFEVDREWDDTLTRYNDARARLELTRQIEEAQKAKTMHERNRLAQGLTTTFQSLTFEQDYADAQLNRLRVETEILTLHARLRLFATK